MILSYCLLIHTDVYLCEGHVPVEVCFRGCPAKPMRRRRNRDRGDAACRIFFNRFCACRVGFKGQEACEEQHRRCSSHERSSWRISAYSHKSDDVPYKPSAAVKSH